MATLNDLILAVEQLQADVTSLQGSVAGLVSTIDFRKSALDGAVDDAELAKTGAEDARDLAVIAKDDAVQAKDDAVIAEGNASQSASDAEDAKVQVIAELELVERENNTVLFDKNYLIGNASPRTGNILFDFTNARRGTVTRMLHQDASAFTFPAEAVILSGDYDDADLNYIWFVYTKSGVVEVTISQEI